MRDQLLILDKLRCFELQSCFSLRAVAEAIGVDRRTLMRWLKWANGEKRGATVPSVEYQGAVLRVIDALKRLKQDTERALHPVTIPEDSAYERRVLLLRYLVDAE